MNSSTSTASSHHNSGPSLEQQVRSRIETMSFLPTAVSVVRRLIDLGKDPDAEPASYAEVIRADSSLSSKLLALANSSFFGVRHRVTKVQSAVNLLGVASVRTLTISYCITGLHNELRLSGEEAHMLWTSSLCKAVAAQQFAALRDRSLTEEAFAGGLFQDFAIPVMYATAREPVLGILRDEGLDWRTHLERDRALFHQDHASLARAIAQRIDLPTMYIDAVAHHHDLDRLRRALNQPVLADAIYVAGLFPHLGEHWNERDAKEMRAFVAVHGHGADPDFYIDSVQQEFDRLHCFFEDTTRHMSLADLLVNITKEAAEDTTRLVGNMHELIQRAATAGLPVHQLVQPPTPAAPPPPAHPHN